MLLCKGATDWWYRDHLYMRYIALCRGQCNEKAI